MVVADARDWYTASIFDHRESRKEKKQTRKRFNS
jgi:hypothetical protein